MKPRKLRPVPKRWQRYEARQVNIDYWLTAWGVFDRHRNCFLTRISSFDRWKAEEMAERMNRDYRQVDFGPGYGAVKRRCSKCRSPRPMNTCYGWLCDACWERAVAAVAEEEPVAAPETLAEREARGQLPLPVIS